MRKKENLYKDKKMLRTSTLLLCFYLALCGYAYGATQSRCPEKIIETGTVEGVYQGVDCGDFCYASIKLDNGEEFVMFCGEDDAEKYLGKKGNRVSVTYDVMQFWNEFGNVCTRSEVFKSGRLVGTAIPNNTKSDVTTKNSTTNQENRDLSDYMFQTGYLIAISEFCGIKERFSEQDWKHFQEILVGKMSQEEKKTLMTHLLNGAIVGSANKKPSDYECQLSAKKVREVKTMLGK